MPGPRTLCEMFQNSLLDRPREVAFQQKQQGKYVGLSSSEFADRVRSVSSALHRAGIQQGDHVAILAETCLEWALADYAILHCGAVSVPIYPTLQPDMIQWILKDCGAMAAFVMDDSYISKLGTTSDVPHLQKLIVFRGEVQPQENRSVMSLRDFEKHGLAAHSEASFQEIWRAVEPDDLATIIYTSGTTGTPKGVMLSHANIVSNVLAILERLPLGPSDKCLSFLPLSHVFERLAGHFAMWHAGACITYAESIESVPENLIEVKPSILISVPRLYEKMYSRILAAVAEASPIRRQLFRWAQRVGRECVYRQQNGQNIPLFLDLQRGLADKLVFGKLRERLGGQMRYMVSGGAALTPEIAEFFYAAHLVILEGYGLTETSPVLTVNPLKRPRIGTVGPPIRGVELKLSPAGEILARGPNIMKGYYNNVRATNKVLIDGWFHTGDIGEFVDDGYLRITDRIKDLLVTAGGKNIAPQRIESKLKSSPIVAEAICIGERRNYLTALIIPSFENISRLAQPSETGPLTPALLTKDSQVRHAMIDWVVRVNLELASFERIKRFVLLDHELQIEAGEITPTLKVKRNVIRKNYASVIDSMYIENPLDHVSCLPRGEASESTEPIVSGRPTRN